MQRFTRVHFRATARRMRNGRGTDKGPMEFVACNYTLRVPESHLTQDVGKVTCASCKRVA